MGYRWHDGRLLSDEEFYSEYASKADLTERGNFWLFADLLAQISSIFLPAIVLGIGGYFLAKGIGIILGLFLGGIISYSYKDIVINILRSVFLVLLIGIAVTGVGTFLWAIIQIK